MFVCACVVCVMCLCVVCIVSMWGVCVYECVCASSGFPKFLVNGSARTHTHLIHSGIMLDSKNYRFKNTTLNLSQLPTEKGISLLQGRATPHRNCLMAEGVVPCACDKKNILCRWEKNGAHEDCISDHTVPVNSWNRISLAASNFRKEHGNT